MEKIGGFLKQKSTLLALLLSFFGGAGLYCLMGYLFSHLDGGGIDDSPIFIPCSFIGGWICLIICCIIFACYISLLCQKFSAKQIIFDIVLVLVTFIPFLWLIGHAVGFLTMIFHIYIE